MTFSKESELEAALIQELQKKGWEDQVLKYSSEEDLLRNWANILFENNKGIDRLNDTPLSGSEMQQIIEQIKNLKTPLRLNGFINGKTVSITRDNPADTLHLGKEISLKIYDRKEIAAGQSRYQIVQQPIFKSQSQILNDRRGDLMLLINGMPVIHIELKRSGVPVSQAYRQIEKYSKEGLFQGLFSLIQIFVAMEPEETVYFANPGIDGKFNEDFYFHWADFNNEPINDWKEVASTLLYIPLAHQLIGFYTVADESDGILKVMRSYQYYAANAISDKVSKTNWKDQNSLGGYIWHTTGSGKTMTSFKSAQLIANSKDADKVVFLMDRIELGTQSLREYRGFAGENEDIQATENTGVLVTKLKSTVPADTLIVSSIQKMSNISEEADGLNSHDIEIMKSKRIVFIVDEAHRSTFGDMLITIKETFPSALFFGFTGTPIQEENQKKKNKAALKNRSRCINESDNEDGFNTTATVFGNELHRYSIADGIRDKNVLGFDPYKVMTYKDRDLRKAVALLAAKAQDESEALSDPQKKKAFNHYMQKAKMAGYKDDSGKYIKGIEDELPSSQYRRTEHWKEVVKDIIENFVTLSQNYKYHAILATSSISEAIEYYCLLKDAKSEQKTTVLFDPNIDNNENDNALLKEEGLEEIIGDYNEKYGQDFSLKNYAKFKKDVAARLAHKLPYLRIEKTPEQQIDLLIVVDQMLTGFDSKWLNTLYLDKVLQYENVIQAFSRTNRLAGPDKPFGTIRYYRKPHSMERHINEAVKLYSGDKPMGLFVDRLESNIRKLNSVYNEISELFKNAKITNFEKLPEDISEQGKFAKLFKELNAYLEAARIQGLKWSQSNYSFGTGKEKLEIELHLNKETYLILAMRYKELLKSGGDGGSVDVPFEINGYLTEIDTGTIDTAYMNTRFEKFLKILEQKDADKNQVQETLDELHKSFASLSQEDQKYANIFIHDVRSGDKIWDEKKTFREHITEYRSKAESSEIDTIAQEFGLDKAQLEEMMKSAITGANINEYGRFKRLKESIDKGKAKAYFEKLEGKQVPIFNVNVKLDKLFRNFIITGNFDLRDRDGT